MILINEYPIKQKENTNQVRLCILLCVPVKLQEKSNRSRLLCFPRGKWLVLNYQYRSRTIV
jgi:hypothetical protein